MIWINVLGGALVLGSYAACFAAYPGPAEDFWGGVPVRLRSLYTASMLAAAVGYFAFTFFLVFRWQPEPDAKAWLRRGAFEALYAAILFPSALWMPLTYAMLASPGPALWAAIRLALLTVAIGSLGLLAGLVRVRPRERSFAHELAVIGGIAFSFQTAILDALVWPAYFAA